MTLMVNDYWVIFGCHPMVMAAGILYARQEVNKKAPSGAFVGCRMKNQAAMV
jgi:hypothetical protein